MSGKTQRRTQNTVDELIVCTQQTVEQEAREMEQAKRDVLLSRHDLLVLENVHQRVRYNEGLDHRYAARSLVTLHTLGYVHRYQMRECPKEGAQQ